MPLYEYKCEDCRIVKELVQEPDEKHEAHCTKCGKPMDRIWSVPSMKIAKSVPWNWDRNRMDAKKDQWAFFRSKELNGEKVPSISEIEHKQKLRNIERKKQRARAGFSN